MTFTTNPYETLYNNLKEKFTVVYEGSECTVGDYMLMKAGNRSAKNSSLPTSYTAQSKALANIVDFVNEKLMIKNPPKKDQTIRRFPIKTSFSALLSSVAACALVLSCGIFALSGANSSISPVVQNTAEGSSVVEAEMEETPIESPELETKA